MVSYRTRTIETDGQLSPWSKSFSVPIDIAVKRCERDLAHLHILGIELQRYAINGRLVENEAPIRMILPANRFQTILDGSLTSWLPRVKKAYAQLLANNS